MPDIVGGQITSAYCLLQEGITFPSTFNRVFSLKENRTQYYDKEEISIFFNLVYISNKQFISI